MISLYDIISGNVEWLAERLDFYVLKMDCLRNTGFSREKQKIAISVISDCIGESCKRNNGQGNIEPDDDENNYRFIYRFLEAYYSFNLGINRNNILRLIKLCKRVYIELVQSLDISLKEQKDCCMFVDAFFDNFEISIFDNWYSVNSLKENGNFTYDEFRKIALMVSQTAALGIIVVKDNQLFYINEYIERLSGYDLFELKNLNPLSIIDRDYHEFFIKRMELCSKGIASSGSYTLKITNKFGEVKHVDISEKNIFTDGSKIILMTVADITAYRQVQDKLLKNSESLRTLIDAMTDIVCFKDESGRWLDANETAVDLFDLHDVDYRGMTNSELAELNNGYFKDVCNYCNDTDEKTWQSGHVLEYEEVINKPDGSKLIYEITKVPLYYGDGKRKSIVALGKDVTNKKESENKLRESEERYRKLFDLSPDAIFIRNGNTIALANQAGIKFFGKETLDEIKGRRGSEFVTPHPDYKPDIEEFRKKLEKDGFIPLIEEKFIRKSDGKIMEYETTCSVFPYEGTNTILVISRDISERNKAEKLKSEMNEKDMQLLEAIEYDRIRNDFFTNISHELRTPLNVILGTLQLFEFMEKNDSVDYSEEKFVKYIRIMKQNCYRLVKIVNNLIDITKIDSGYFPVHMSNNNIVETVENIVDSIVDYGRNKGIRIQFDTEHEEKIIRYDPDKIERIMLNLLSNAIKFTGSGGNIKVRVLCRDKKVAISVKDTGIGIPEDKLPLIFDKFIQVDRSLSRMNEGSGIGLSIVKALVEMHGGTIGVSSRLGEGSEFIIELPDRLIDEGDKEALGFYNDQNSEYRISVEFSDIYF